MRVNIYTEGTRQQAARWFPHVQAIALIDAQRIAKNLEAEGKRVAIHYYGKNLGKCIYETAAV